MPKTEFPTCSCGLCDSDTELKFIHERWLDMIGILNERQRRLYTAEKAMEMGYGGIMAMARISGLSERTIRRGVQELKAGRLEITAQRSRTMGGGRKWTEESDPTILSALEELMEETVAGDPMSLLKWTTKSTRSIAEELTNLGHAVSPNTVLRLLRSMDYSLRGNTKSLEGQQHPQRDSQFRYINQQVKRFLNAKNPVISVDTKKKEKVGLFHNSGRRWRKADRKVNTYDFPSLGEGVAIPYGILDQLYNQGFVNVGISHDTAEFATESIDRWWRLCGRKLHPKARRLLITADGGGSNGSRNRLWKLCLQGLANRYDLEITVCHYPPGTSKWNRIEHALFSFISITWGGEPLETYGTIISAINSTTTKKGLKVKSKMDTREYETGIKIPDDVMNQLNIKIHKTNPKWNYTIEPNKK